MTKRFLIILIFLCALTGIAHAASLAWISEDTFFVTASSVRLTRPDNRWRVIESDGIFLVELRLFKNGADAVMTLKSLAPLAKLSAKSGKLKKPSDAERLIQAYRDEGYLISSVEEKYGDITAKGESKEQKVLLLKFFRKKTLGADRGWFVLEARFPKVMSDEVSAAFEKTSASLRESDTY